MSETPSTSGASTLRSGNEPAGSVSGGFFLALPYLVAGVVVALMLHGALRGPSVTVVDPSGDDAATHCDGQTAVGEGTFPDPVCQMTVGADIAARIDGQTYYFCTENCRELFTTTPERYLAESCAVCRSEGAFRPVDEALRLEWEGETYAFCSTAHREAFRGDPAAYFLHSMWGIPSWLYYASIGLVMLFSFAFLESAMARGAPGKRVDLLRAGWLRWLLTRPQTRFVFQLITAALFLLIIAAGLFGNQLPSKNVAPLLTWTVWWGGLVLLILYAGKLFCYMCPWDALAGWLESWRLWGRRREGWGLGLRVGGSLKFIWPAIFLFVFLTWIELGLGVTLKPRATAYLALAILGLAIASALIFERRFFCRYVCLVGRISGLYALFSPVEVRARDVAVCRSCKTHSCYKGNEIGNGCPTWQFPGTMPDNTYCTMCMECLRTCEPQNMTLNLRPWGEDLKKLRRPRLDGAVLALVLLALTGFHGLTMTRAWRDLTAGVEGTLGWGRIASFSLGMAALLVGPILVYAVLVAMAHRLAGPSRRYGDLFVRYSYSLLPIAFFYHLAHNAEHLLMEGQKVIALLSDPFGREWNLLGTARLDLAPLVSLTTLWGIQVFLVLVGHVYGVWAACKVSEGLYAGKGSRRRAHLPLLVATILFSVFSLWLLKQPMEMRSSAM